MEITTNPPTEPGYYLRRSNNRTPWHIWQATFIGGELEVLSIGSSHTQSPTAIRGEWLGPFDLADVAEWMQRDDEDG